MDMSLSYQQIRFCKCLTLLTIFLILIGCFVTTATCSSLSQSQSSYHSEEVKESSQALQAMKFDLQATKLQLKKTQQVLTELITTLLKENSGQVMLDEEHRRAKRATSSSEDDDYDEILGHLPISALAGLRCKDGRDGAPGSTGTSGKDGADGKDGKDGAQGVAGPQGAAGLQGRDGRDGADGRDGKDGEDGVNGQDGLQGNDGNPGTPGDPGEVGQRGPPGSAGEDGKDGEKGSPGVDGIAGQDGTPGTNGATGSPGRDGLAGLTGRQGPPGRSAEAGGAVYTRWGRTTCGNSSTLLYHGFAGGSRYDHTGGGTNYQCMPPTPEYSVYNAGTTTTGFIAGTEYETYSYGIFPNSAMNSNVPCARCHTNNRSAVMLLPARRTCPQHWNKEYEGYLMSEYHNHPRPSTFECVDAHPEYISGAGGDTNGALFYFVKAYCSGAGNTHHCPPYAANKELTCVICSK